MALSPGISFLVKVVGLYVLTFASVYAVLDVFALLAHKHLPTWAIFLICTFSRPFIVLSQSYYTDYRNTLKASALGAAVIPKVNEGWPAGWRNMRTFLRNLKDGYPGDFIWPWIEKYGYTFHVLLPSENRLFTFEPDHIKAILSSQFDSFEKGPMFMAQAKSLLGTGIFNSDSDTWKFHRTITRPFFIRERISDFEIFGKNADDAISLAKARLREGYPIDFQDLVSRFTLDSATEFLFGNNVNSLSAGLAYPEGYSKLNQSAFDTHPSNRFTSAFMEGQDLLAMRLRKGGLWPLSEIFEDKIANKRKVVDEFMRPILERAIQRKREEKGMGEAENVLDHLVQQTEDETLLMDELLNLLVAGRDTTASLLTFSVYMMAEHPDMTRCLREEILSKIGPTDIPTYGDIREMKYLRAFLNEVLRLYPSVPFNGRMSNKDTILPSSTPGVKPLFVPDQTRCFYGVFIMHRRADLWGPDAMEFDPNRFIDSRLTKYLTPNPFIFCPFNAGPRICLGQQFAYQEASFFLIRLLQQFSSITLAQDALPADCLPPPSWARENGRKAVEKVKLQVNLTMSVKGGLWVRMAEAKDVVNEAG